MSNKWRTLSPHKTPFGDSPKGCSWVPSSSLSLSLSPPSPLSLSFSLARTRSLSALQLDSSPPALHQLHQSHLQQSCQWTKSSLLLWHSS